jgi:nucleotide-binding universal stress UspA family protein
VTDHTANPTPSHWPEATPEHVIVVGVDVEQQGNVLPRAAALATQMSAGLVCAWVDATQVIYGASIDGTRLITPLDPDQTAGSNEVLRDRVAAHVAEQLRDSDVPWRVESTVGDIASGLTEIATDWDAQLIVVGSRRPGFSGWMNEVIGGSIAGHLVHTQARPVLIVPCTKESH